MKIDGWNLVGTGLLALLVILCILTAYSFLYMDHQELSSTSVTDISFDLLGIIICTVIFTSTLLDQRLNMSTIIFLCILTLEALLLFWDVQSWLVDGDPSSTLYNKIINYYIYGLMLIILIAYWFYLKELYDHHKKEMDRFTNWVLIIFLVGMLLVVTNPFTGLYFDIPEDTGSYVRSDTFFISIIPGYAMMIFFIYCIWHYEAHLKRKVILLGYIFIPTLATAIQYFYYGISLQYISMLFSIILIYANIYIDRGTELIQNETEMTEQRATVMVSQIQPHFLYNALTSIMNIKGNPPRTRDAIADFGRYMRGNLDSITQVNPIPIMREIDHVETYIELRRLKYGDRINIEYKIDNRTFFIPPQTVKIIVATLIDMAMADGASAHIRIASTSNTMNHVLTVTNLTPTPASEKYIGDESNEDIAYMAARIRKMVEGEITNMIMDGHIVTTISIPRKNKEVSG